MADQPADPPSLDLQQVLPQEAFQRLGERQGVQFALKDGQEWIGAESGVGVTADLREASFWEAVLVLSKQTGYEPVFEPYGSSGGKEPVIWLRRVAVAAEEKAQKAVAAGPLLIRAREAVVTIPLKMSQLRMTPMQAAVHVEVFLEPGVPAAYVTAAALRAVDEEGVELRRGEGFDPTVAVSGGVAELHLHFDVIRRVPLAVGQWQALMRIVEPRGMEKLRTAVTVAPEEVEHAASTRAAAPTTGETAAGGSAVHLGPYQLLVPAVRVGGLEGEGKVATVRIAIPRGQLDSTAWGRLYGFLIAMPPRLASDSPAAGEGDGWKLSSYAVVSTPAEDDPEAAGVYRVWARYEAPAETPAPAWLEWELPVQSEERRAQVRWTEALPIAGPREATTRKLTTRPAGDE